MSDGLRGNASTAAFVARGFPAHFGGESGQVSFAHMPNASLDEVADRIEERQQEYDATVLFLQLNGLHNEDGDYEGEPERFRAYLFNHIQRLSPQSSRIYIFLGAPAGIPYQGAPTDIVSKSFSTCASKSSSR